MGGKGIAKKPSNFPLKECISILDYLSKETNGKVYLDPCCGWGIRLLSSAVLNLDYIGFDVNANLVPKLKELAEDIKLFKPDFKYHIFEQGSQFYISDLEGFADFSFTSPPYFNLEDYGNNDFEKENSYRNVSYDHWLSHFVDPLTCNLTKYVKKGGLISYNIKDFNNLTLVDDFTRICQKYNLTPYNCLPLKNITRVGSQGSYLQGKREAKIINNDEWVYVFKN